MRKAALVLAVAAFALTLHACAASTARRIANRPQAIEAVEEQVEGCEFVGTVSNTAGGMPDRARRVAFQRVAGDAAEKGATHFVVLSAGVTQAPTAPVDTMLFEVTARAYRCVPQPGEPAAENSDGDTSSREETTGE